MIYVVIYHWTNIGYDFGKENAILANRDLMEQLILKMLKREQ